MAQELSRVDAPEADAQRTEGVPSGSSISRSRDARRLRKAERAASKPRVSAATRGKQARSLAIMAFIVPGLVATVALPAFASMPTEEDTVTLQQVAQSGAQSLVVASEAVAPAELSRESYSATTPDEIAKKKAADALAKRLAENRVAVPSSMNLNMVAPGTGAVRWPISGFRLGRGLGDSGYHQGVDLLAPGGTPLFAAADGVVRVSSEGYSGYGVAVVIEHVINGQRVSTLYGHMTYGSRQVVQGQTVAAGQLIGLVGSTGSSTANHLHFEVRINGGLVDPWAWLNANAG